MIERFGINDATTYTGLSAGSHTVVLSGVAGNCTVSGGPSRTVSVPSGGTAAVGFSVTCSTPNRPPVVDAGPDNDGPWWYTVSWGDGSSSSGSTASQGTMTATHNYLLLGSYTIRVTVTDSHGASGSDTKVLTGDR